jgi:phage terminase small subunit
LRGVAPCGILASMTPKQTKFARVLFECGNQSEAYRQAYNTENMSDSSIGSASYELSKHPEVVAYLADMQEEAEIVAQLSVAWVLKQYMQIATADVNELIESRRVCCRYCHGIGHAYQWLDENEWARAMAQVIEENERAATGARGRPPAPKPLPTFDGGAGFWGTEPPHAECPVCFGDGEMRVHVHDTRRLKGAAKLLYAGVKQTANGIEVKTRDQDEALAFLARYLGLDKKTLELSGPGGSPLQSIATLTKDPVQAARTYAAIMAA